MLKRLSGISSIIFFYPELPYEDSSLPIGHRQQFLVERAVSFSHRQRDCSVD